MRVAVISDLHGNANAAVRAIDAADERGVDEVWCLGDIVGDGPDNGGAIELVRRHCQLALAGNHDRIAVGALDDDALELVRGHPRLRATLDAGPHLSAAQSSWLSSLPASARRHGVVCWHATPDDPLWGDIHDPGAVARALAQISRVGLVGHSHRRALVGSPDGVGPSAATPDCGLAYPLPHPVLLNPGAIDSRSASWLELDVEQGLATWHAVE